MPLRRNTSRLRRVKRTNPLLAAAITVAIVSTLGVAHGYMASEVFILGSYLFGLVTAVIAWFWPVRWKEGLWVVGTLLVAYSMASMFLTAQYWLAVGAFTLFVAIIVYPTIRSYIREEIHNGQ